MSLRKNIFRTSVILFAGILSTTVLFSQERVGKEARKSFATSEFSKFSIENRFGNIEIKNWDKNSVDILVQVMFYNISESKAKELLDRIELKQFTDGDTLYFETDFDDDFGRSLFQVNDGERKFEINYTVSMPHNFPVNIQNKFGDIIIEKLSSPSVVKVMYGNLKAIDLTSSTKNPLTYLSLEYSNGDIDACSWLKVQMKYSKLTIDESTALIVLSKYSKLFMQRGSSLVSESKYDTYELGTLANLVISTGYSNIRIKSIGKKLNAETKYSDIRIGFMPASFEEIMIENKYGAYKIGIEDNASYKLEGYAKYGNIVYPNNSRINRFQETSELRLEGTVGTNSQTKSKVEIDTKYGTINLE